MLCLSSDLVSITAALHEVSVVFISIGAALSTGCTL